MYERRQRLKLGVFILGSTLLLAVLIVLFGGAPDWFLERVPYTIIFTDAPGIGAGTPVRKSGVKVGEVNKLDLDPVTGEVRVLVRIDPKFEPRTSDVPTITRGLLSGDTAIDFVPKPPDRPQPGDAVPPGTVIRGYTPPTARQVLEQATEVIPEAERSLNQIRISMQKLEELAPQINTTLREVGELARVGREFIPEVRRATDDLRDIFASMKDIGPEFRRTGEELRFFLRTASVWTENIGLILKTNEPRLQAAVDSFTRTMNQTAQLLNDENQKNFQELLRNLTTSSRSLDELVKNSNTLVQDGRGTLQQFNRTLSRGDQVLSDVQRATGPLGERGPRVMQNLESGTDQFNRLLLDLREIIREAGRSDGTVGRLLTDPTLYNNLVCATEGVARLLPRLDRALRDLEVFADKIARHPESLGVGGAVRPSSGLKEGAPTSGSRPHFPQ